MRRYELGLARNYVNDWSVQDALREFLQNGIDQEKTSENNPFTVSYDDETKELSLCNKKSILNKSSLLLGSSTKIDDPGTIGKFGEGYKLAVLVLLREGKNVVIDNYGVREQWNFRFSKLKKYDNMESLVCDVDAKHIWQHVPDDNLTIRIGGITQDEYDDMEQRTLFLWNDYEKIPTVYGDILREEALKEQIFVNGLYVCKSEGLECGYDIKPEFMEIGRDRNLVDSYNLLGLTKRMWLGSGKEKEVLAMVKRGARDLSQMQLSYDGPTGRNNGFFEERQHLADMIYQGYEEDYGDGVLIAEDEEEREVFLRRNPSRNVIVANDEAGKTVRQFSNRYSDVKCEAEEEKIPEDQMCLRDRIAQWSYDCELSASQTQELFRIIDPMIRAYIASGEDFYGDLDDSADAGDNVENDTEPVTMEGGENGWIATDDFQRIRKIDENRYELIDATAYVEDGLIINEPEVIDLRDYYLDDGTYTDETVLLIGSFHSSVSEFEESYAKDEDRHQVLAEMIYETKATLSSIHAMDADEATAIIDRYVKTGVLEAVLPFH